MLFQHVINKKLLTRVLHFFSILSLQNLKYILFRCEIIAEILALYLDLIKCTVEKVNVHSQIVPNILHVFQ